MVMLEVRFHGRGGQGAVVASNILALAFFKEGRYVQSFPSFGGERRGAPVMAFLRVNDHEIEIRSNVYRPDHVVVLDVSLTKTTDVTAGLKSTGWVLLNSAHSPETYLFSSRFPTATIDANDIAARHRLGTTTFPIVNTAILGAFARVTGIVTIESVLEAVKESVPNDPDANVLAALEAYKSVSVKAK
jgi:2-oxoacid:acceptor oxidoreductase gamma subunit (pyruvate/2-ketoisovalerate family)